MPSPSLTKGLQLMTQKCGLTGRTPDNIPFILIPKAPSVSSLSFSFLLKLENAENSSMKVEDDLVALSMSLKLNVSGPSGELDGAPTIPDGRDTTKTVETNLGCT
ncbi:hypothetical protein Tco_0005053 [Tanacetum coccineum]